MDYSKSSTISAPRRIPVSFWTCFFTNSRNGSYLAYVTENNTVYSCKIRISYLLDNECDISGRTLSCGYYICVALTVVIVLFANFGLFSNVLNLLILPKSLKGCSVKRLMLILAAFDLLASICAIPTTIITVLALGKYENGFEALETFRIFHLLFSLGRTGSIFTTIMITVERYIAVAYPFKQWLRPKNQRIQLFVLMVVIFLLNLPWWLNKRLENNIFFSSDNSTSTWSDLSEFPYVFTGTAFSKNVYPKIVLYHVFLDFAFPFPMLLAFNALLYRAIYLSNKARQTLTISQRREVNAAKTFSIIAFILLLCHTVALIIFVCTQVLHVQFRELQFCQILSATMNASINFIVYYAFGKSFRDEFWTLIRECKLFRSKVGQAAAVTPTSSTIGTIEMAVSSNKLRSLHRINHYQSYRMNQHPQTQMTP